MARTPRRHGELVRRALRIVPLAFLFLSAARLGKAAVYYVRTDGGSPSQCSGSSNLPYPGQGSGQPCAWNHPFCALPPGGTPRIAGGDTLHIGSGSYRMGAGAPETSACDSTGAWDCVMPPIPGGSSPSAPTRMLGDCTDPPELWGAERADEIVNLTGSSNVEVGCLEITDHSDCVEFHSGGLACNRDVPPYGDWASRGIYAADSQNVVLHDLDIHGLASTGIQAGRLRDWTVDHVRIAGNGWVGWDGDILGEDWNEGTMRFTHWRVEWNGCGESWPDGQPAGCWAQTAGGYGDGVGTGETHGTWIIEDSQFLYNTSDGLDLLYLRPGGSVEIRRTLAVGNAGNQIKTAGPARIENSIIVGNCGWFENNAVTWNVDPCRAAGNALSLTFFPGDAVSVVQSTIASEGDCVLLAECAEGRSCSGAESLRVRNDILIGAVDFGDPTDRSCLAYLQDLPDSVFDMDSTIAFGTKGDCRGLHSLCNVDPLLAKEGIDELDARLLAGSPAIGAADINAATTVDFYGLPRDASPDIGAVEYRAPSKRRRAVRNVD